MLLVGSSIAGQLAGRSQRFEPSANAGWFGGIAESGGPSGPGVHEGMYVCSFDRQFVEALWQAGREGGGYCSVASENPRVFGQDI